MDFTIIMDISVFIKYYSIVRRVHMFFMLKMIINYIKIT